MSDPQCPILVGDSAASMTALAYEQYSGFAIDTYHIALNKLDDLGNYVLNPVSYNASFDPSIALTGYVRPTAPEAPTTVFHPPSLPPSPPAMDPLVTYVPSNAPVDTTVAPTYTDIAAPVLDVITAPGEAPGMNVPSFPVTPTYTLPDVPSFVDISLPAPPSVTIPTFDDMRPTFDAPIPDGNFSFSPEDYSSSSLTLLTATIDGMITNPAGLPAAVAQALRDRATVEADNQEFRAIQQAYDEFADRGFFEPSGLLHRRIAEARQQGINARSSVNRDIYIQDAQTAIDNLKFAIQTGVQLEGKLIDQHVQFMQMQLEAAKYVLDAAIAIFNARVSVFNAKVQAYGVDAQVFRDLIQAELSKVEVYKAELDGERLKGEINQQRVQLYTAQLQGVQALADIYNSQLRAVATEVEANKGVIEAYEVKVRAYSEQLRAQSVKLDIFRAQLEAENTKAKLYEISTEVYSNRIRAWSEKEQLVIGGKKLNLDFNDARLKEWQSKVALFDTQLKGELARVQAEGNIFGVKADIYKSAAQVESAAADADNRAFQLNLAQEQAVVDTEFKRADRDFEQFRFLATTMIEKLKTIAQIAAQLSASSMSAVNFHAGVTSSLSQSYGCNTSINYSGSIEPDAGAV